MQAQQIIIPAGLLGILVAVWVYLKGGNSGADTQVSYPNANASGLPQYQSPGVAYNFGSRQPAPSPSLVRGTPPPIPPTPTYQNYNYAPLNIWSLTPEAAMKVAAGDPGLTTAKDCCCNDCGCDENQPYFQDGNRRTGVVASRGEQAAATPPKLLGNLNRNLATSAAMDEGLAWQTMAQKLWAQGDFPAWN